MLPGKKEDTVDIHFEIGSSVPSAISMGCFSHFPEKWNAHTSLEDACLVTPAGWISTSIKDRKSSSIGIFSAPQRWLFTSLKRWHPLTADEQPDEKQLGPWVSQIRQKECSFQNQPLRWNYIALHKMIDCLFEDIRLNVSMTKCLSKKPLTSK